MSINETCFPQRADIDARVWSAKARSTALRLLMGAGRAHLVAYRGKNGCCTPVAHTFARTGEVVFAIPSAELAFLPADRREVRVSIEKEAPHAGVCVVAAALHFLGQAQWYEGEEAQAYLEAEECGSFIEAVIAGGGALAIVETSRVLIHDSLGVTPIALGELTCEFMEVVEKSQASGLDEYAAVDMANEAGLLSSAVVLDALMLGTLQGAVLASQDVSTLVEEEIGMVCVDVDSTGLTLMYVSDMEASTIFLPFTRPVRSLMALQAELGMMCGRLPVLGFSS